MPEASAGRAGWRQRGARLLRRLGHAQSTLLLTLVYGLCWLPAGLVTQLAADWLRRRAPRSTNWYPRATRLNDPTHVHQQF